MYRMRSYRGGGIFGYWGASVMARIQKERPNLLRQCNHFGGSSTGALLAVCDCLGMSFSSVMQMYVDYGPKIFSRPFWRRIVSPYGIWYPLYSSSNLKEIVCEVIKRQLGRVPTLKQVNESGKRLQIAAVLDDRYGGGASPVVIDSAYSLWDNMLVSDAAAISCCEPYYFDVVELHPWGVFSGGGLFCNDMSWKMLDAAASAGNKNIAAMTIGTGDFKLSLNDKKPGALFWLPKLTSFILDLQVDNVNETMHAKLGHRYHLVNDNNLPVADIDDVNVIPRLAENAFKFNIAPTIKYLDTSWSET